MAEPKIVLRGLTKFDTRDLGAPPGIEYREAELEPDAQGEVMLFTAIVTMALVSTVAAYLLRKHNNKVFEEDIEVVYPDGRVERRRIRLTEDHVAAPDAAIIRQIQGGGLQTGC